MAKIRFTRTGWIQQIDFDAVIEAIAPGTTLRLDTSPGRYAIAGTVLATVDPEPVDPDRLEAAINEAMLIGATRTMQQDAPYALRQLADVALKALSPGINDPTTTQDAIFHLAAVLAELIRRDPPPPVVRARRQAPGRRPAVHPGRPGPARVRRDPTSGGRASGGVHLLLEAIELTSNRSSPG